MVMNKGLKLTASQMKTSKGLHRHSSPSRASPFLTQVGKSLRFSSLRSMDIFQEVRLRGVNLVVCSDLWVSEGFIKSKTISNDYHICLL